MPLFYTHKYHLCQMLNTTLKLCLFSSFLGAVTFCPSQPQMSHQGNV